MAGGPVRGRRLAAAPCALGLRAELPEVEVKVAEWIKRAGPLQRKEAQEMLDEIRQLKKAAEKFEERAAPALEPTLKAVAGHLNWADKILHNWLMRNPG